jgi:uncharacterized protein with GYD domain
MATYIILSSFASEAFNDPKECKELAQQISARIRKECPGLKWKESYSTLGSVDIVDIVESKDPREVQRAAMILRAYGHETTETLTAISWKDFLKSL